LLGALWLDHARETPLPAPTGPFAVGRVTYAWTDPAQAELLTPEPSSPRQVLAWIWYPAAPQEGHTAHDAYLPATWQAALARTTGVLLSEFLTRDLSRVRTHSVRDAPLSPRRRSYPVLLMRGGHSALTTDYTTLAEDLASHGYVVLGFDAPYRTFVVVLPDGRVIVRAPRNNAERVGGPERERLAETLVDAWSSDMSFALDHLARLNASDPSGRFTGRLDLEHVGAFGHSLGGAEALQFCHDDARCKAGIDVDGAPFGSVVVDGVRQPFMFLGSDHRDEPAAETRPIEARIRSIFQRVPDGRGLIVTIRGAGHFGFADDVKSRLVMSAMRALGHGRLDGQRQLAISVYWIRTFFDVYLQGAPAERLRRPGDPDVEYGVVELGDPRRPHALPLPPSPTSTAGRRCSPARG
jgi:predicted dienelactone hydrolase